MRFYTIAQFKANASQIVREVNRTGEDALITVHGGPMVVVCPANEDDINLTRSPRVRARVKTALKERKAGKVVFPGRRASNV